MIEEDIEEWEKMAAMWKFQGKCDPAKITHEGRSSHFRNLDSIASEGKTRFVQKFCLKEVQRVMEEEEIGAKQAVMELAGKWERDGSRPVSDGISDRAIKKEKLGILKPKIKESLNMVGANDWKRVRFCLDSGGGRNRNGRGRFAGSKNRGELGI